MTNTQITEQIKFLAKQVVFENSLTPGQRVTARWTSCHTQQVRPATVVRLNRASVRVQVDDGRTFSIPRLTRATIPAWTTNNSVSARR